MWLEYVVFENKPTLQSIKWWSFAISKSCEIKISLFSFQIHWFQKVAVEYNSGRYNSDNCWVYDAERLSLSPVISRYWMFELICEFGNIRQCTLYSPLQKIDLLWDRSTWSQSQVCKNEYAKMNIQWDLLKGEFWREWSVWSIRGYSKV